ncbi:MAG: hypothetical protein RIT04_338 [Candidatus Parcubacteria bacterium]|jgi:hypothetical protein
MKMILTLVTSLALFLTPFIQVKASDIQVSQTEENTQPKPNLLAECGLAAVVIIVGGIVIIKMVRLCQKVLPPTPPPSTNNVASVTMKASNAESLPETDMYAALIILGRDNSFGGSGVSGTMEIPYTTGVSNTPATLGQPKWNNPSTMVSQGLFASQLAEYGLGFSQTRTSYSSNAIPVTALDAIQYTNGVLVVKAGSSSVRTTNVFERSVDMVNWTPILTNIVVGGSVQGTITDSTMSSDTGFYRIISR